MKNYKVQYVLSNERVKIKLDNIQLGYAHTELRLDRNKPGLTIHCIRTNEITLVEVGITNKNILVTTELIKSRKYELLANELMSPQSKNGHHPDGHYVGWTLVTKLTRLWLIQLDPMILTHCNMID